MRVRFGGVLAIDGVSFDLAAGEIVGLVAPAGTPADIIARLNADTLKTLKDPTVLDRLEKLGFEAVGNSPAEFAAYVRAQADTLGKVIRNAGIKPQ